MTTATNDSTSKTAKVRCGAMLFDIPVDIEMPANVAGDYDTMSEWLTKNRDSVIGTIIQAMRDVTFSKTKDFQVEVTPESIDGVAVDMPPINVRV